jgi:ActD protein
MAEGHDLLVEFSSADALLEAVKTARNAGYSKLNAYTPFPVEGLAEALGFKERIMPMIGFAGAVFGAALGYFMQVYVNIDFPLNSGGRDIIPVPAFLVVTFELTILFSAAFLLFGMLALDRLPRLHHPLFDIERFHLASKDRFFLRLSATDPTFNAPDAQAFFRRLSPISVHEVPL